MVFGVFTELRTHCHSLILGHFHDPQKKLARDHVPLRLSKQPLIDFPSLWICLCQIFPANEILQHVALCDRLLSRTAMFGGSAR